MADTNFAALTSEQLTAWGREFWRAARNASFVAQFSGSGPNACFQRIKDLRASKKGARAVLTLIQDLESDGVVGDYTLEGNEEAMASDEQVIRIDQLRNANRSAGRLAEQKSVVTFRRESRDKLAYWLGDRLDQVAILTLSGIAYTQKNNGTPRPVLAAGQNLGDLEYAGDVTAPTSNRHFRWSSTAGGSLEAGDTTAVAAGDTLTYKALVLAKAQAKQTYMRGIRNGGREWFHVFVGPTGMANLRLDNQYRENVLHAAPRSKQNELFTGAEEVTTDGLIIHEHRHVFNTLGATGGNKWGATGTVDGERVLFCGAQALGFADIGMPYWDEREHFDYGNKPGISIGKICGFKKPVFESIYTGQAEDFGVLVLDTAL